MSEPVSEPGPSIDTVSVELGDRRYDILVGRGLLAQAGEQIAARFAGRRCFVITDRNIAAAHLATLERALSSAGLNARSFVVDAGEATKDFAHLESLIEQLLEARIERSSLLVALGGGVIGDLAGFAASIILRGIDFIQVPTSLLAQVDSSVGGKTAINSRIGKNLIGSFHQPRLVLADTGVLDTLPRRELLAGYAEVVKYGLIDDPAFFAWLEANGAALIEGDDDARRHAIVTSCRSKARIVAADERETGVRALLNFGHTFAHALEAETGYGGALLHGEAVGAGLGLAFSLSSRLGLCPPEDTARVLRHLAAIGLPTRLADLPARDWRTERLIEHMAHDKKVRQGRITFVLARGIGRAFVADDVPVEAVRGLLDAFIAAGSGSHKAARGLP
ncbi:MAG: 3-dehydroquinate synthase [Alphaproteobacteria bacterium]